MRYAAGFILLLIAGFGLGCRRNHLQPVPLVGKLVINGACDNYVVQVISGQYDPSKVAPTWKDPSNDTTYTNVFTVTDRCTFSTYGIKQGQLFSFLLNDSTIVQTCAVCEIFVAVPPVYNTVNAVHPLP